MQMIWIIAALAGLGAFVCLVIAMSKETNVPMSRFHSVDRSVVWSCGALGLMLVSLGALAAGA
jgi:hypothetical protein